MPFDFVFLVQVVTSWWDEIIRQFSRGQNLHILIFGLHLQREQSIIDKRGNRFTKVENNRNM